MSALNLSSLWLSPEPWAIVLRMLGKPDVVVRLALRGASIRSPFRTDNNPSAQLIRATRNGQWVMADYAPAGIPYNYASIQEAYAYACTRKWERFSPATKDGRKALAHWTGKMVDAWNVWTAESGRLDAAEWWQSDTVLGQVGGHVRSLIVESARRGLDALHIDNKWLAGELRKAGIEVTKEKAGYALRLLVRVGLLDRVAGRSQKGNTIYNYSLRFDAVADAEERLATLGYLGIDADSPSSWHKVRDTGAVTFLPVPVEVAPAEADPAESEPVPQEVIAVPESKGAAQLEAVSFEHYLNEIERFFYLVRMSGFVLSQQDAELVRDWHRRGIPLQSVVEGILAGVRQYRHKAGPGDRLPHQLSFYSCHVDTAFAPAAVAIPEADPVEAVHRPAIRGTMAGGRWLPEGEKPYLERRVRAGPIPPIDWLALTDGCGLYECDDIPDAVFTTIDGACIQGASVHPIASGVR